jgi:hypothetical protein
MVISEGKQKNSQKNLLQYHFVHHESDLSHPGLNPGFRGEKQTFTA